MKTSFTAILAGSLFLFSCKKENDHAAGFSEAGYTITITGQWSVPRFGVPAGAHFTTFVGMVHNDKTQLWKTGSLASPGTELLAEIGNGTTMLTEIDSMTRAGNAGSLILFTAPQATGTKTFSVYCNSRFSQVSFASMLGSTPDWFTGVSGLSLFRNNSWIRDTSINLYVYDAGTEEGNMFSANNPPSMPHEPIRVLTAPEAPVLANGNPSLSPIATARFTKL